MHTSARKSDGLPDHLGHAAVPPRSDDVACWCPSRSVSAAGGSGPGARRSGRSRRASSSGRQRYGQGTRPRFGWRKLLETGVYGTIEELAGAEKINSSYVSRILRLTLLAPQIVEAILDGRQPEKMTLVVLMEPLSVYWAEQSPPVDAARATDAGEPGSQVPVTPAP